MIKKSSAVGDPPFNASSKIFSEFWTDGVVVEVALCAEILERLLGVVEKWMGKGRGGLEVGATHEVGDVVAEGF